MVDLRALILKYLAKNCLMTIATSKDDKPWAATVFFAYDNDLNLYFLSAPTRKTFNILANPQVAAVIDRDQPGRGKVRGIQLEGQAVKVTNQSQLAIFSSRYPWASQYLKDHHLFMITPSKIIYLDDEQFGPQGKMELNLANDGDYST